jgi:hypothetical protein
MQTDYKINLEVRHDHLERIDIDEIVASVTDPWWNQTLTQVNDSVVRLGIVQGEFHWHKHDDDDEFFLVSVGTVIYRFGGSDDRARPESGDHDQQRSRPPSPGAGEDGDGHG